jgi:creatinine amidohydrolase
VAIAVILAASAAAAQTGPPTRDLERINWMEFREWVPAKIDTVLLPLGTMEPHGVTANGSDIIAPVAIARAIAPRVSAMIAPVVPYGVTGSMDAYPTFDMQKAKEYFAKVNDKVARLVEEIVAKWKLAGI